MAQPLRDPNTSIACLLNRKRRSLAVCPCNLDQGAQQAESSLEACHGC